MPAVARKNDRVISPDGFEEGCDFPGETSVGEVNSKGVYANKILIVVLGNTITPHVLDCYVDEYGNFTTEIDRGVLVSASSTVKIGGKGVGRVGDRYTHGDVITQGSPNVFAGG